MAKLTHIALIAFALTSGAALRAAAAEASPPPDSINNYLVDLGAGHVAANELIGLSGSAVSNLQTPKDVVAALAGLGDPSSKNGLGLAWSPGRSSVKLLGVSAADYAATGSDAKPLSRLWANTTLSYAQNSKTINSTAYRQRAAAINLVYYPKQEDDPLVVEYQAFFGMDKGKCGKASEAFDNAAIALTTSIAKRVHERQLELKGAVPKTEMDAIKAEYAVALKEKKSNPVALGREVREKLNDRTIPADLRATFEASAVELGQCATEAAKKAAQKWNASHLDFLLGQAWIRGDAAGAQQLSLGRHATLALALEMPDGLFNLTLKRVDRELDQNTLTTMPGYKSSSIAAARYTYRMDEDKGKITYVLAEVSNAKTSNTTAANSAFKWALGLDRQLGPGVWAELRLGRARVPNGTAEENKALMSFKISPDSGLLSILKPGG